MNSCYSNIILASDAHILYEGCDTGNNLGSKNQKWVFEKNGLRKYEIRLNLPVF
jgi:hypothetical protein